MTVSRLPVTAASVETAAIRVPIRTNAVQSRCVVPRTCGDALADCGRGPTTCGEGLEDRRRVATVGVRKARDQVCAAEAVGLPVRLGYTARDTRQSELDRAEVASRLAIPL
jgi:hypothetical protein